MNILRLRLTSLYMSHRTAQLLMMIIHTAVGNQTARSTDKGNKPLTQERIVKLTELGFVWRPGWGCPSIITKPAAGGLTPVLPSLAAAGSDGNSDISTETEKDIQDPRLTLSPLHKDNKTPCDDVTVES